ncbi:hypothetical protein BC628DRAFT_1370384, partial [Trametes gibbosa]
MLLQIRGFGGDTCGDVCIKQSVAYLLVQRRQPIEQIHGQRETGASTLSLTMLHTCPPNLPVALRLSSGLFVGAKRRSQGHAQLRYNAM